MVARRWLLELAMLAGTIGPAVAVDQGVALVIGNARYAGYPPTPACEASARIVASALARAGFAVRERSDLSNAAMGAEVSTFADAGASGAVPGAATVVYVCGYVASTADRLFLLPVSARLEREGDVRTQGLTARLLGAGMTGPARAGLVLLDLVSLPGDHFLLPDDAVAGAVLGNPGAGVGLIASRSLVTPGDGTTPLAAAAAASFVVPDLEMQAVVRQIAAALAGMPGQALTVREPERAAWLAGAPPAPTQLQTLPATPVPSQAAEPAPPATAQSPAPLPVDTDLRRVQLALQQRGYYAGKVDGRPGPETTAAIRRFQHELKADMSGRLTADQARQLLAP